MKPMNRIRWSENLRNRRTYRVSQRLIQDRPGVELQPVTFRRGEDLSAAEPGTRAMVEHLLANAHIASVEISRFDIKVVVEDFSFGRHALHMHCLATIHQYLWGQDADVLVTQETFLD